MSESISQVKRQSVDFITRMLRVRRYDVENVRTEFYKPRKLWELFTTDEHGKNVLAVFTSATKQQQGIKRVIEDREIVDDLKEESETFHGGDSLKTDTDFIKSLVEYCTNQDIKILIIVSDDMTHSAIKTLGSIKGLNITHFTYTETCMSMMGNHVYQPSVFRRLLPKERGDFVKKNPLFEKELPRFPDDDALVKFHGYVTGDIVFVQDVDPFMGFEESHNLVVERWT